MSDQSTPDLLGITAQIVISHVANNHVDASALPGLIQSVYRTLLSVGEAEIILTSAQSPAVPLKKSVFPDFIICFEDGKKLKMLKRHLQTSYGMTPKDYRAKWGLSADYPMVAPNYASKRSILAKSIGLGRKLSNTLAEPVELAEPIAAQLPARRARGSKC